MTGARHQRHRAGAEPAVAPSPARTPAGRVVRAGGRPVREILGFTQPGGVAAVGKDVAVVDVGADVVTLIEGRSLRVLRHVPAGTDISHDIAGPNGCLIVADTSGDVPLVDPARVPSLR